MYFSESFQVFLVFSIRPGSSQANRDSTLRVQVCPSAAQHCRLGLRCRFVLVGSGLWSCESLTRCIQVQGVSRSFQTSLYFPWYDPVCLGLSLFLQVRPSPVSLGLSMFVQICPCRLRFFQVSPGPVQVCWSPFGLVNVHPDFYLCVLTRASPVDWRKVSTFSLVTHESDQFVFSHLKPNWSDWGVIQKWFLIFYVLLQCPPQYITSDYSSQLNLRYSFRTRGPFAKCNFSLYTLQDNMFKLCF